HNRRAQPGEPDLGRKSDRRPHREHYVLTGARKVHSPHLCARQDTVLLPCDEGLVPAARAKVRSGTDRLRSDPMRLHARTSRPSLRPRAPGALAAPLGAPGAPAAGPSAGARISSDAASRAATTTTGRTSISWSHTIGGGADRALVVGVAVEDTTTADANVTSV